MYYVTVYQAGLTVAMFLLGYYAGRRSKIKDVLDKTTELGSE